ncbi:protein kinase domain-containing protein [Antarcticirhabdus aurantiaca]|uniref:Uncharacterized protein n=1 Tax=Antarcticirhabdus aurantiaca TaxID=2606717 RepID=A0ACD4NMR3_9HYPH|nr:hypothetical protein OXU80_24535 [Jeongeuplla avenae]
MLDLVEGPSLAERLSDGPPLSPGDWMELAARLLDALAAVHASGRLHLDLAPANVLLPGGDPGRALLCDFGLCLPVGAASRTRSPGLDHAGTPGFAAPEAADPGHPLDVRADLYGLGRTLLAALPAGADSRLHRFAARLAAQDPATRPHMPGAAAELARLAAALGTAAPGVAAFTQH